MTVIRRAGEVRRDASSWELLRALIERQVRLRAKRAVIGTIWPAVVPLVMLGTYSYVFGRVFTVPIDRYPEFLLAGLLPWSLLSQGVSAAVTSLSNEADLIRRAPFRHELLPIAAVGSLAVYFLAGVGAFVLWLALFGQLTLHLLPVLLLPIGALFLFVSGVATLAALFDVYNRDLRWIHGNLLTVWFFLVPIVYRHSQTPPELRFLRSVDPMNLIVGQFRDILYWGGLSNPTHVVLMVVLSSAFFVGSIAVFRRASRSLAKDL